MRKGAQTSFRRNPTPTIQSRVEPAQRKRFRKTIAEEAMRTRRLTPEMEVALKLRFSHYEQPLTDQAQKARDLAAKYWNFHGGVGFAEIVRDTMLIWLCGIGLNGPDELYELACNWERFLTGGFTRDHEQFAWEVSQELQQMAIGREAIKKELLAGVKDHSGYGVQDAMRFLRLHCMEGERYYIGRLPAEFALNRFAELVADQLG